MKRIIQQLIIKLESLPKELQNQYLSRWLGELERGDGATLKSEVQVTTPLSREQTFSDKKEIPLEQILGGYQNLPADLSHNPTHLDRLGSD